MIISYKRFPDNSFVPSDTSDGLQVINEHYEVDNCIFDMSYFDLSEIDEALGVTWGGSGIFNHCRFTGAGKLVLCGSGDRDKRDVEDNKEVVFNNCIFENFGRRGPEVQCGMIAKLNNCIIKNWGYQKRFITRAFGAWAHDGGQIYANNCVFIQESNPSFSQRVKDKLNHIGQAFNDEKLAGLIKARTYVSGWKRGLTQGPDGYVEAVNCYASDGVIIDNLISSMSYDDAMTLYRTLYKYFDELNI